MIVVGAGIVGAATALAAARRGASVTLLERAASSRAEGSSRGGARIICPSPLPDATYLEMGLSALAGWRRIEEASATRLLEPDGAISVGTCAEAGRKDLAAAGVAAEKLDPEAARARFGVELPADRPLLFQPDAGVIRARDAHRVMLDLARDAGADLQHGSPVDSIDGAGERLEVRAGEGRWRGRAVVLAAGPSNRELAARLGIDASLEVTAQTVAYFEPGPQRSRPIVVMDFDGDEPYALWEPGRGLKAAFHAGGTVADPEREAPVDHEDVARIADWVAAVYPGAGAPVATETCKYTRTPDERFVIERHGRVVLASACNGQGFQFAPETGERAADLALDPAEVGT